MQPSGFLIVDDYGAARGCKRAIEDYRALRHYRLFVMKRGSGRVTRLVA